MKERFIFVMIRPTHYDNNGYPIQWWRSVIPSNSMAAVYGLAKDCQTNMVLGEDVDIELIAMDETNTYVDVNKIIKMIQKSKAKALVGMVGVQSNQFPRAVDLSKPFLDAKIPVCIGGFHVSGCLSMLDEMPQELKKAQNMGISFFAGELEEGRLSLLLQDVYHDRLKPIYNYLDNLPKLDSEPTPFIPKEMVDKTFHKYSSFDLGRGCPFDCSFCTIINVQGKKSRFRTPDDVERIIRENHHEGINKFFLTDDNFARNRNWEPCIDRIIELRESEGIKIRLLLQVDTKAHKVPRFIEKCVRAGVDEVFIGIESVNLDNLVDVGKKQNNINEYKAMLLEWKKYPVITMAGYIIGLPNDTKTSVLKDIETLKNELAIDIVYFTMLQPLPGSEDHQKMVKSGEWMDSDMNKYDTYHRVTHHHKMSDEEWEEAYQLAWENFYTFEHMERVLRRMVAFRSNKRITTLFRLASFREYMRLHHIHPVDAGVFRIKRRQERRRTLPIENPIIFYSKYIYETITKCGAIMITLFRLRMILNRISKDPFRFDFKDNAMTIKGTS